MTSIDNGALTGPQGGRKGGSRPTTVSDALAILAHALVRWEMHARAEALEEARAGVAASSESFSRYHDPVDILFARFMENRYQAIDTAVHDRASDFGTVWDRSVCELLDMESLRAISWPPEPPTDDAMLIDTLVAAMVCDLWHAPLDTLPLARIPEHDEAEYRLDAENRYNESPDFGFIIPSGAFGVAPQLEDESIGIIARYFTRTRYLPRVLVATDPDDRACMLRHIPTSYLSHRGRIAAAGLPAPDRWKVAVAPLAEAGWDVDLKPSADRQSYGMALNYDSGRIERILTKAIDAGAHLLFVPEMALREADLAPLKQTLLRLRREHFAATSRLPQLFYLFVGVLDDSKDADGHHKNYVVILDADGNEFGRQVKLAHWNLSRSQQDRFGVTHHHGIGLADPLLENSAPATTFEVVDLPMLGRATSLICADINQNDPGDWLMANVGVAWLNFPIMDKSICWERGLGLGFSPPWIVPRAHRACLLSGACTVVTNSMSLTAWVNGQNRRTKDRFGELDLCGVGLLLHRGADGAVRQQHILVPIDDADSLTVRDWDPFNWDAFPYPVY